MPQLGDIYRLPDRLTAFSADNTKERWCMVVSVDKYSVRVAPRSKSASEGVYVEKAAMPAHFTEDGHFYNHWQSVAIADLRTYECVGRLDGPWRSAVIAQYDSSIVQRDERRDRQRRGR